MFDKYEWIQGRYEELSEAISQPEVLADSGRYQACLKERAALAPRVEAWGRYQALLRHLSEAEEMLSDPDLAEEAQSELDTLRPQKEALERELRLLLLPRDPHEDSSVVM